MPPSPRLPEPGARYDALVVGAGMGGLGAALALAEGGARVALCEALTYPGGCAATFRRGPHRFDAGATLVGGLDDHQHLGGLLARHALRLPTTPLDPVIHLRAPGLDLPVDADKARFVDRLCALPGAPAPALRRFFSWQGRVADGLWALLDQPERRLPAHPLDLGAAARALPALWPLAPWLGRPLLAVLRHHGVDGFLPLRLWADATCQITVQTPAAQAEAAFALGALDYVWRGARHVEGGVGEVARALCEAVRAAGGEVFLGARVRTLRRDAGGWTADVRGRPVRATVVLANQLPQDLAALAELAHPTLTHRAEEVSAGWGACMHYLALDAGRLEAAGVHRAAAHLELVADPAAPLVEGNHVFCSLSGADEPDRAPPGQRVATLSTHIGAPLLRALPEDARGARVQAVQDRMRATLAALAPALSAAVLQEHPASPRTFQRFTRRAEGLVGGVPRRAGLRPYLDLWPAPPAPGLYMVGDTVFPGQSALATLIGGRRAAERALRELGAGLPARR
ncbi:NAD(P)-binding protein [Myxococcota bacterium]|nr:NAD(P)-binding protein [Myxococcota bacterium]